MAYSRYIAPPQIHPCANTNANANILPDIASDPGNTRARRVGEVVDNP